jgi:hypothetical protein
MAAKGCTFAPDLTKPSVPNGNKDAIAPAKGVDAFLTRITQARRNAEETAAMRAKGWPYSTPPHPSDDLFEVEITIGSRSAKLVIDPRAPIETVLTKFALDHELDSATTENLLHEIKSQLT